MKNIKYLILLVIPMLVITGCGSKKTLKCEKTNSTITYNFNKDKMSKIEIKDVIDLSNEKDEIENFSEYAKMIENQYNEVYENIKGIKYTLEDSEKDYTITITLEIDTNKINNDELSEISSLVKNSDLNYKDAKEFMENNGYTCK